MFWKHLLLSLMGGVYMSPAINLTMAVLALTLTYFVLRPQAGWYWRWHRRRGQPERVQIEDALKHLYGRREAGSGGSIDGIAGALEVSRNVAAALAHRLERRGLLVTGSEGLQLTEGGRRYALQIIRTHRLWEQYLAEQTGIGESEWHERADRVEHELTPDQADALAARMGDPVFDPHGDPIPSSTGAVRLPEGRPINAIESGQLARIVHIEDEPESTYRILRDAQLQSGMIVTVVESRAEGIEVDNGVTRCVLAPLVAANVTVQPVDQQVAERISLRRLSSLVGGEEATVTDISPACRGVERRRLLDLGLVPGTVVKAEFASPSRDPVAYRVRGGTDCPAQSASGHDSYCRGVEGGELRVESGEWLPCGILPLRRRTTNDDQ